MAGTIAGLLAHQARLRAALTREAAAATDARRQRGITESNYRDARDAITGIWLPSTTRGLPGARAWPRSIASRLRPRWPSTIGSSPAPICLTP